MAGTNQFYPFATGSGANALTAASWFALNARQSGFSSGIAKSIEVNTALRQSAVMISMIGDFIKAAGLDALDNGDLATLLQNFQAALAIRFGGMLPASTAYWHFGVDSSTNAAAIVADVTPAIANYASGLAYSIKVANTAVAGGTVAGFGGRALRPVKRSDGTAIRDGDWTAGQIVVFLDDGASVQLVNKITDIPAPPPAVALWHVGTATGAANALTVSDLNPSVPGYSDKLPIFLTFPGGVADNGLVAVAGFAQVPIQRNDGSPIQRLDIPPGSSALFNFSGTGALRLAGFGRAEVQRIALNPILWVRPDGNDNNDGSANTAGGAFATIGAALTRGTSQFNFASSGLTIRLGAPGTYASPQYIPRGTGTINIVGDAANQAGYIITGSGSPGQGVVQTAGPTNFTGLTIRNTSTDAHTLAATTGSVVLLFNTTLQTTGTTTGFHAYGSGGSITLATGCIIQGNANCAMCGDGVGQVAINTSTVLTIQGTPTFSLATAFAVNGGKVTFLGGASIVGSANGQRYLSRNYAIISTNGGGPNAIPGSTPGAVDNALYL